MSAPHSTSGEYFASHAGVQTLDAASLPLHGVRLIEASAGTGKTWTIAALYLRLILGHGNAQTAFDAQPQTLENADDLTNSQLYGRALAPSEILVMTFTRAATRELTDRIRARLVEALAAFRGQTAEAAHDPFLAALLAAHPSSTQRKRAAWLLEQAASGMDEAAIHTIDAWCQRVLREHALQSGARWDEQLDDNPEAMLATATMDYWREQVYAASDADFAAISQVWADPDALRTDMQALYEQPMPADSGASTLAAVLHQTHAQREATLAALSQGWVHKAQTLHDWLEVQLSKFKGDWSGKLRRDWVINWAQKLQDWAAQPHTELRKSLGKGAERFSPDGMQEARKAGAQPLAAADLPDAIHDLPALLDALDALVLPDAAAAARAHAAVHVAARVRQLRAQSARFGFADLQQRLDATLDSARGADLLARLRQQYPVALIDEFQDTSALQYRLFARIYGVYEQAENPNVNKALFLIGDPKQSIYRFRGADIESYLRARAATAGRHYVLGTNRRSSPALVCAVNALFARAEQRAGAGAFGYRCDEDGAAGASNPLPFLSVGAAGRSDALVNVVERRALPALALHWHEGSNDKRTLNSDALNAALAGACAEQIVGWLNDGNVGFVSRDFLAQSTTKTAQQPQTPSKAKATLGRGCEDGRASTLAPSSPEFRPLAAGDIAILVHTSNEAALIQDALRARGLNSVYVSERQSVFCSEQALDLLHWLRAVDEPLNVTLTHTALGTRLMGLDLAELQTLASDDAALDAYSAQLAQLNTIWQRQGVLAMLRQSLHRFGWAQRWARLAPIEQVHEGVEEDSEAYFHDSAAHTATPSQRAITNYLHLAELLQNASATLDGRQALLRWLQTQIQNPNHEAQEQLIRLESDAQLIQIVTIHKSKGLEYPVVCLPFAHRLRQTLRKSTLFLRESDVQDAHDFAQAGDAWAADAPVRLSFNDQNIEQADWQRLREDLRLLYVAATRARHVLWLGAGPLRVGMSDKCQAHLSALGYVLAGREPVDAPTLREHWQAWVAALKTIEDQADFANTPLVCATFTQDGDARLQQRTMWRSRSTLPPLAGPAPYTARFERDWGIGSFSALVRGLNDSARALEGGDDAQSIEPVTSSQPMPSAVLPRHIPGDDELTQPAPLGSDNSDGRGDKSTDASAAVWHRVQRGALLGHFVHEQLQWLRQECAHLPQTPSSPNPDLGRGCAAVPALTPGLQAALLRRCQRSNWAEQAQDLAAWLQAIARAPLLPAAAHAANACAPTLLSAPSAQPELEFWINAPAHLPAERIDALCQQFIFPGLPRPALPVRTLHGMLMGFADLVFAHAGRWWVLDYKTNQLGTDASAYSRADLQAAFVAHRYDVQAAIYLLALHRLLRARLGEAYAPQRHLGGAMYFFVRGLDAPTQGLLDVPTDEGLVSLITALEAQLTV